MSASGGGSPNDDGKSSAGVRGWRTRPLVLVPDRESTSRLTLDFSGPPIPLPRDAAAGRPVPPTAAQAGHDAWAIDHVRRSTPPPMQITPGWLEHGLEAHSRATKTPMPEAPPPSPPASQRSPGTAFDLVDNARPAYSGVDLHAEMADRFALGDFSGALGVAELILGSNATDPAAQRYADASREKLEQFYASRLGSTQNIVQVAVRESDVRWLGLDHRAGFLLSRVDGHLSIEEVIDLSGMPRLEALKLLAELLDQRAVRILASPARSPR